MHRHESTSPETACVRPQPLPEASTRPLVPALEWSVVYEFRDLDHVDSVYAGAESGYVYARDGHPGATRLADQAARLEGAEAGLATSSGMSAEAALFLGLLSAGDHVVLAEGLYGRTQVLLNKEFSRFGVTHAIFDPTRRETWETAFTPATRLVFVESITNPLVRVPNLSALADFCKNRGVPLAVDNTFGPLIARPIAHGAQFVTHSVTKMIAGHSDATAGALVGSAQAIAKIRPTASSFGLSANPFECALAVRGMATLPLRMAKACENALEFARFLELHPNVTHVHYPGLKSHRDHAVAAEMMRGGFGTIVTIDLGSRDAANAFIRKLNGRIPFAPSLGDVATTLSHPVSTSHRGLTEGERAALGITPGLVRLSFGIENAEDLRADFRTALGD